MLENLASFAIWVLLVIALVVMGWDEPLRYKFMRREQIQKEEKALQPPPPPPPVATPPEWRPSTTTMEPQRRR